MRDFIESIFSLPWTLPLLGVQQLDNLINQPDTSQPQDPTTSPGAAGVHCGRLNAKTFIVLGEGLAAGMGDFTLREDTQRESFPARMARQMQTEFPQPLLQAPGIGNAAGFPALPVLVPAYMQTTGFERIGPMNWSNVAIPGYKLSDALALRPTPPLIHRDNATQTASNLILGMPSFVRGSEGPWPTQLEYAVNRHPTFTLVELGYYDVLDAAVNGDPGLLPTTETFRDDYMQLLLAINDTGSDVLILTIPDPIDTAYFSSIETAAQVVKVEPAIILNTYDLKGDDLISVSGLVEIGYQFAARDFDSLPKGAVLNAESANQIRSGVHDLNAELTTLAQRYDALVYDLQAFFRRLSHGAITVGSSILTGEFLGGFYSLNGFYPGRTGHALIANDILALLNKAYGAHFPPIDIHGVIQTDPVAHYRRAAGPSLTASQLSQSAPRAAQQKPNHPPASSAPAAQQTPSSTAHLSSPWKLLETTHQPPELPLQLPPGLEQVLPLSKAASYFGDSILAINCEDPAEVQYGTCENLLFRGLALVNSHLSGHIRIKFTPPANNFTHFEVSVGDGLVGDDGTLAAPQFFKLPAQQNAVHDYPGLTSTGDLNLSTGEVSNAKFNFRFANTALLALARVNPDFPQTPIQFPGQYGSSWTYFEQRPDGKLDFTFYGSTFLPLGPGFGGLPLRFPLPFVSTTLEFASVPGVGTALHPHIQLSTKEPLPSEGNDEAPDIPFNTIQEFTLYTHNSSFGDAFHLDIPAWGGQATGRSHVMGRVQLQFGERTGSSVPIAVSSLKPGGLLAPFSPTPVSQEFPGRLPPGPEGFDAILRFPQRSYSLNNLAIIDDPFDISVGAVDLKTGRLLNELLHRSFIFQDLIYALIRVEPRTPQESFFFRGPAVIEKGAAGQSIFRFRGNVIVPYPGGFEFPKPDLATGYTVIRDGFLEPFLWLHAIHDEPKGHVVKRGGGQNVIADTGDRFSYSYVIPSDPKNHEASFEYENHTQQGKFRLHSLVWVDFSNSINARSGRGDYDTVTFTGFGIWSKDGVDSIQLASVQISTSADRPYVGIQIDSGDVSNVNKKPEDINDAEP